MCNEPAISHGNSLRSFHATLLFDEVYARRNGCKLVIFLFLCGSLMFLEHKSYLRTATVVPVLSYSFLLCVCGVYSCLWCTYNYFNSLGAVFGWSWASKTAPKEKTIQQQNWHENNNVQNYDKSQCIRANEQKNKYKQQCDKTKLCVRVCCVAFENWILIGQFSTTGKFSCRQSSNVVALNRSWLKTSR